MLTCKETEKLLDLYLDGELDALRWNSCREHLRRCPQCSRLLELKRREVEMIRSGFPVPEMSPDFCKRVMAGLSAGGEQRSFFSPLLNFLRRPWLAPALACLILLVIACGSSLSGFLTPDYGSLSGKEKTAGDRETGGITNSGKPRLYDKADAGTPAGPSSTEDVDDVSPFPLSSLEDEEEPATTKMVERSPLPRPERLLAAAEDHGNSHAHRLLEAVQRERFTEIQGTTPAFMPVYLPAGFLLESIASRNSPPADAEEQEGSVREPVLVIFSNPQTGERICLEIAPGSPFAGTEGLSSSAWEDVEGRDGADGGQITDKRKFALTITRYAEKEGRHYTLRISGDVPPEELKKVADSLQ